MRSSANVLRGVHVHRRHHDYLMVAAGTLLLGLHDLRADSPTSGLSAQLTLSAEDPIAVTIPPGVCHGFYFPEPTVHVYAVSEYWDLDDELGCRFDAAELGLNWPIGDPLLSPRDRAAGSYEAMRMAYADVGAP